MARIEDSGDEAGPAPSPTYWLVMPAAGRGTRLGAAEPKQYLTLAGRTVLEHALAPFLADPRCRGLVVALAPDDRRFATLPLARDPRVRRVVGGAERRDSVLAGLCAIEAAAGDPWVLVHDAARPCLPRRDLEALLAALPASPDGALLATPVADTLKRADADGCVAATLDRVNAWRALTPQAARRSRLRAALERAPAATDESSALEAAGARPRLVPGSPLNLKITGADDLRLAGLVLEGAIS